MYYKALFILLEAVSSILLGLTVLLSFDILFGVSAFMRKHGRNGTFKRDGRHLRTSLILVAAALAAALGISHLELSPYALEFRKWATGSLKRYTAIENCMLALSYAGIVASYFLYRGNHVRTLFRKVASSWREMMRDIRPPRQEEPGDTDTENQ